MQESYAAMEKIIPLLGFPANYKEFEDILLINSNLPGPRGNLTLAFKFAEYFEAAPVSKALWDLINNWADISEEEAPANNPREYLTFCGVLAVGACYFHADEETKIYIMNRLKTAMNDKRWRVKESVAMALQRIAEKDFNVLKNYFSMWYNTSNFLEKRAFIATLAHPPILINKEIARFSLTISEDILNDILAATSRRSEDFTVLSKGMQYALSVFVAYQPEEGFNLMKRYAGLGDPDINKIIKANLGKSRLTKKYGKMVNEVFALMSNN